MYIGLGARTLRPPLARVVLRVPVDVCAVTGYASHAVLASWRALEYMVPRALQPNLLGATIGLVTPLCCSSAIPTALMPYRAGSRRGPACATGVVVVGEMRGADTAGRGSRLR